MNSKGEAENWPIFVISLADAHERRQRMQAQCAELGLEFEFIDAIDGRAGLPAEFEAEIDREATIANVGRPMTDAEYATALSHRLVYMKILEDDLDGAVILEAGYPQKPDNFSGDRRADGLYPAFSGRIKAIRCDLG